MQCSCAVTPQAPSLYRPLVLQRPCEHGMTRQSMSRSAMTAACAVLCTGTCQSLRTEHCIKVRVPVQVTVFRHGRSREIDVRNLLVGDVLCFGAGDILPADGIIFNCSDVRWVPALLTHGICTAGTMCCCTSAEALCCMLPQLLT